VLSAWICSKTAVYLWGEAAKWPAFTAAICAPTLLFFTTQIITETLHTFFISLSVFFLARACLEDGNGPLIELGVCAGLLLLLRFNTVFVPGIAAIAGMVGAAGRGWGTTLNRTLLPVAISLAIVSPWLVRNSVVFHGGTLYSSQTGTTALQDALSPDGRTQPYGYQPMLAHHAWLLSSIETDQPVRLEYPSEVELNGEAKANARLAWAELGWRIFPLLAKKARVILAKHGPAIRNRFILGQAARTTRRGNVCLLGTIGRAVLG